MEPLHNERDLLFKGKNIHCRNEPLYKGWGDSLVYSGYFKNKANDPVEEIIVRKIKKKDCCEQWEDIVNKHNRDDSIKHENVLKIISCEEIDEWRFFALERYDATLEQFCKEIYRGSMPSDAQVLCQITKGLLYLHKEQCSHGNLTPRTVLIASSQPVVKLSEFGLCNKFGDQCDDSLAESDDQDGNPFHGAAKKLKYSEELGKQQDLCERKYWIFDRTTEQKKQNQNNTPNQDIFSAGCVCFYFLTRGVHPFGDDALSIINNMKERNPVNLLKTIKQKKDIWEFAYDPIKNMIGDPPTDGTNWLMIAENCFMKALPLRFEAKKENELGNGMFGVVYKGTFEGNAVAVKVTVKNYSNAKRKKERKREMEEHLQLDHKNVLKLLHVEDSRDKTCLVLELCAGTLKDYCEKKYKGPELPPDGLILYQIANGLHYIHSRNLVHRDVKPDNILISMTTPVQMKLSDFGFVKKTSHRGTFTQSGLKGTEKWMAPEILKLMNEMEDTIIELPHGTIQSDTFAAGCVFFYFLTRGKHPFGKSYQIMMNILNNNPIELNQHKQNLQGLYELIRKMIKPKEERILLPDVIKELTAKSDASRQFNKFEKTVSGIRDCAPCFHPTEPVFACNLNDKVILLSAENSSIPFSNWNEKETQLQTVNFERCREIKWNVDGTQLAAIAHTGLDVTVWSYPSGAILFQKKLNEWMDRIKWNPFKPNIFATFHASNFGSSKVLLFNSCPDDPWQFHFHFFTIEREERIESFQWISENRVALGLRDNEETGIWEVDESTTSTQKFDKRFGHESVKRNKSIVDVAWDERTKCLAACSTNRWMTIWSTDSDQPIHALQMKDVTCLRLAWRPNGKQSDDAGVDAARKSADNFILAGGCIDGKIVIWTPLLEEKKTRILSQHSRSVDSLSFSPDGRFLASGSLDKKLIIWATESTLFQNWQPVYIGKEGRWDKRFSWLYSLSTDVPNYKLTFNSSGGEIHVVEYAVGHSENPSNDGGIVPKIAKK